MTIVIKVLVTEYVQVKVKTHADGIDSNTYTKLSVDLILDSYHLDIPLGDLYSGYPKETNGVLPYTDIEKQFTLVEEIQPSIIKGLRLIYKGQPPDGFFYNGDNCVIEKIKCSLFTTSMGNYYSIERFFSKPLTFEWMGTNHEEKFNVPPEGVRGKYHDTCTIAWKQMFRSVEQSPNSPRLFPTGNTDAIVLTRPYQVSVENKGLLTTAAAPKILDETSELNDGRTFYVELVTAAAVTLTANTDQMYESVWAFHVFWHPQAVGFLRLLQAYGVPQLLSFQAQKLTHPALDNERRQKSFFENYYPTLGVSTQYPVADVDFTLKGAYSDYNWELFFHAPLLIAQRLSEAGQFEEAERWFKLLFDPARGRLNANPLESFQTQPLREAISLRLEDMLHLLDDQVVRAEFAEQVDRLNRFPYQPHLIARSRLTAYQKTLVMKYLDHLISWGDELFRRAYATDNRTELENAGSRYDLVARLLGKRPEVLPSQSKVPILSFDALWEDKEELDLWDPLVKIEDYRKLPRVLVQGRVADQDRLYRIPTGFPPLKVLVHIQGIGDQTFHENEFAGTRGQGRQLEGFQIDFNPSIPNLGMRYMAHLQNMGDVPYVNAGQFIGTRSQGRRLEGFSIELTESEADNYEVLYKAHLQGSGETELCRNGQFCGTRDQARSVEAILVRIEKTKTNQFGSVVEGVVGGAGRPPAGVPNDAEGIPELYFCVPHNDELLKYWDTLADRLAKLRSCRDIEGVRRTLSLYGRRIDPGLLVRATAMGLDIDVLLGYLSAPLPRFRFGALLQRARGACDRAQAFGQALLTTIEKREAEELAKLRTKHEVALLREAKRVRDEQVNEAEESLEALRKSRDSAEVRYRFYSTRKRLNTQEAAESKSLEEAVASELLAAGASSSAADLAFVPNIPHSASYSGQYEIGVGTKNYINWSAGVNYDFGGQFLSKLEEVKALGHRHMAERKRIDAARLGREAQHDRRWDDWQLQKELAEKDMEQIDRQIASAEIRVRIAEIERENQLLQIDQAETVDAYLRDKFTNVKLYRWMESRLSRLYYQQYRLAYDLALKAQRALRYELGFEEDSLLPDTWDPSRRGMEAASDLQHELEKLETRYMDSWRREHEKQKTFSLADRRPLEFLELRQTGSCVIRILEHEFDEDEPGDYFRRIRQVSVSIPCVVGPDVSVNARLTLLRSEVRTKPHSTGNYARAEGLDGANDDRFRDYSGGTDHIVTSTGVNDTGQFDTGLAGDRLLPFEGAGVISTWQVDLPTETNHFDRTSLADVKLRILYTARDGGDAGRTAALKARAGFLERAGREVLIPLASGFSNAWVRFTGEHAAPRKLEIQFRKEEHLPFSLQGPVKLVGVNLYFEAPNSMVLAEPITGTLDSPYDLRDLVRFTPKESVSFDSTLDLTLESKSAVPTNGWAVLIVKKA
jgi:hypothetical protein